MVIRGTYLATVLAAVLFIAIGHNIAINNMFTFPGVQQEVVRARVQGITERIPPYDEYGDLIPMLGDRIIFEARVANTVRRGETVAATQNLGGLAGARTKEVTRGDSILLIWFNGEWHFNGYLRTTRLLGLGILFTLCVLLFGGKKGFNTILSLGFTCGAIFAVFIPSILSGANIYLMAFLVCAYTIAMTLLLVIGFNKKALCAALGCGSGIVVAGIITAVMDRILLLTGIIDEYSLHLVNLPLETPLNLKAIIFAGIIIGAMGAVMDVAMSISSSLWELKEKAPMIKFEALFRSGINIGRDIMGSMANTLILAYIGSALSVVLLISVYSDSLFSLLNSEMIVVEILKALAGSFGILFAMPLTALFCAVFYLENKRR